MILKSKIAGSWYPGTEREIRALRERWEKDAARGDAGTAETPNVLVLPHAGWTYSGETAWTAVRGVRGAPFRRIVVLAPSHRAQAARRGQWLHAIPRHPRPICANSGTVR